MTNQQSELVTGDGHDDGMKVDITRDLIVADPDYRELLRNTDTGDGVVEDNMSRDVSAVCYLEPVFASARLAQRSVS